MTGASGGPEAEALTAAKATTTMTNSVTFIRVPLLRLDVDDGGDHGASSVNMIWNQKRGNPKSLGVHRL
jgi:hypothetical protein